MLPPNLFKDSFSSLLRLAQVDMLYVGLNNFFFLKAVMLVLKRLQASELSSCKSWPSACSVCRPSGAVQNREVPPCHWDVGALSMSQRIRMLSCTCGSGGSDTGTENVNSTCVEIARLFLYKLVFGFSLFTSPFLASETSTLIRLTWWDLKQLSAVL